MKDGFSCCRRTKLERVAHACHAHARTCERTCVHVCTNLYARTHMYARHARTSACTRTHMCACNACMESWHGVLCFGGLCFMFYALCFMFWRFMLYALCFMFYVFCFMFWRWVDFDCERLLTKLRSLPATSVDDQFPSDRSTSCRSFVLVTAADASYATHALAVYVW